MEWLLREIERKRHENHVPPDLGWRQTLIFAIHLEELVDARLT